MKKRITAFIMPLLLILTIGCGETAVVFPADDAIKTYRDIPGVTEAEISAIEGLKSEYGSFSFGHLREMETVRLPDGTYSSFTSEFCKLFSELFEIDFIQKPYDDWHTLKTDIDSLATDFTGDLTPTLGRMRDYEISNPIANRTQKIYTLKGSPELTAETDISGLKFGFLENSVNIEPILARYPELTFETVTVDYISSVKDMLISRKIDAFVTERNLDAFFMGDDRIQSKDFFPLAYTTVSLITANHDLAPVISVMDKYLAAGGDNRLYAIYKENEYEYTKQRLIRSLTSEEREHLEGLLADTNAVYVALEHDNYPISFYNKEEKEFQGIAVDVLNEISKLTGIRFQNVTTQKTTWAEILEALRTDQVSIVSQLGYSDARAEYFIWSKVPYVSHPYVLISKMDYPVVESYQIPKLKVGVVDGTVHEDMYHEWFPESDNLVKYDTQNALFSALEDGAIDLVMTAEYMLLMESNYREKHGFTINYRFDSSMASTFGLNRNEEILCSIIDKAQRQIALEEIANYWNSRVFNYSQKVAQIRTTYLTIFSGAVLAALLAMFFLLKKNMRLGKSLTENVTMLSTIYASIPDMVFSKDTDGAFTSCNPSFEAYAGIPESELIGKNDMDVFAPRDPKAAKLYMEADRRVLSGNTVETIEETIIYPDKSQRMMETRKAPMRQNGRTVGLLGISRDVTERREVENRLERIINTAQIAFILTIDNIVIEVNEYSRKHIGVNPGDDIRQFYSDLDQRDTIISAAEQLGMASNVIVRYNLAGGEVRRFLVNMTFVEYEQRNAYIVWALDIEQDEKNEDQLRILQRSFNEVLDVLPMPIRILDLKNAEIIYANDSLTELLEYESADEICGLKVNDIVPDIMSDGTPADERVKQILNAKDPSSIDIEYITKSGRIIESLVVTRHIDYQGSRASIGIIKDLTTEKEHARILLEMAEREKEANQSKSLFLANMSHEIRTPMNGIIGMTDLLMGENLSERQRQYVKDVKSSAESLLCIINDILDLSKIGEGKLQITSVDVDLSTLLKNTASMMRFSAQSSGLEFIDDIRVVSPEYVRVDDVRLKQILVNLLSNAIKFTKSGYVKLTSKIEGGNILFEVADTGIGIKKEDISVIFAAFGQADSRKNRAIKGTGLGLSISKSLTELMGGRIWVESEYGFGSTFYVSLPYEPGDESAVETPDAEFQYIYAPSAQVLLVDDIQTNLTVGAGLLRMCNITADVATSGQEAVELVQKKNYDIVFMDHMMPEMDGIEAMKLIRGLGEKYLDLPIVALTANAVTESRELLLKSGMNDFMSKPIHRGTLVNMLQKWLPPSKIEANTKSAAQNQSEALSESLSAISEMEGIDIDLALNRISGMQDILETSIKQIASSAAGRLKNMDELLARNDFHNFSIEAHGFKGALANIGAMRHSELAAELEIASKAGNTPLCAEKFAIFADVMESFADKLKSAFPKRGDENKPQGDAGFLALKLDAAVSCLNAFEAEDALKQLEYLDGFTFGSKTDDALYNAKDAIKIFKYKKAVSILTELTEN